MIDIIKKEKTFIAIVFILFFIFIFLFSRNIIFEEIADYEQRSILKDIDIVQKLMDMEKNKLDLITSDWAIWDDTYFFALGENEYYIESNMMDDTFENFGVNFIVILDNDGNILFIKYFDIINNKEQAVPENFVLNLEEQSLFAREVETKEAESGILEIADIPYLVSFCPIIKSNYEGSVQGLFIVGKKIDNSTLEEMSEVISATLTIKKGISENNFAQIILDEHDNPLYINKSEDYINILIPIVDLYSQPIAYLEIEKNIEVPDFAYQSLLNLYLLVSFGFILLLVIYSIINLYFAEKKRAVTAMKESEAKYRLIADNMIDLITQTDTEGNYLYASPSYLHVAGWSDKDLIGKNVFAFLHPENIEEAKNIFIEAIHSKSSRNAISRFRKADGSYMWSESLGNPIINDNGDVIGMILVSRDINEKKIAEEALRDSEEKLRLITDNMIDIITQVDYELKVTYASPSHYHILGWRADEIIGKNIFEQIYIEDMIEIKSAFIRSIKSKQPERAIYRSKHRKGHYIWLETVGKPLEDEQGNIVGAIFASRDVSDRKKAEDQLKYIAEHDSLTGLYNRSYFEQEVKRIEEQRIIPTGIIICDLDNLKLVNDTLGHHEGDKMLYLAARTIKHSCPEASCVARIGGDEFGIILPMLAVEEVKLVYNNIKLAFAKKQQSNPDYPLSISLGYAVRDMPNLKIMDVLRKADELMYKEKMIHSKKNLYGNEKYSQKNEKL